MIIKGRGSIVDMPNHEGNSIDFMDPAYIRDDQLAFLAASWPTSSTAC